MRLRGHGKPTFIAGVAYEQSDSEKRRKKFLLWGNENAMGGEPKGEALSSRQERKVDGRKSNVSSEFRRSSGNFHGRSEENG